jgi:hypothetical protein
LRFFTECRQNRGADVLLAVDVGQTGNACPAITHGRRTRVQKLLTGVRATVLSLVLGMSSLAATAWAQAPDTTRPRDTTTTTDRVDRDTNWNWLGLLGLAGLLGLIPLFSRGTDRTDTMGPGRTTTTRP